MENNKTYSGSNEKAKLGMLLERLAIDVFESSGYIIEQDNNPNNSVDFVANNNHTTYYIEIKATTSPVYSNYNVLKKSILHLTNCVKSKKSIPVLMVFATVPEDFKSIIKSNYKDLVLLDLSNILFALQGTKLQEELIAILPFSIDNVLLVKGALDLGWIEHSDLGNTFIKNLDKCLSGKKHAFIYETACFDMLKYIFAEDLSLWEKQPRSNKDLYRFDLLCRIKDNTEKTFWSMMERYFKSKYIIFEYKNYSNKITQKEIYTTEKYLYKKALRSVAVIITKNGFDDNSFWATKGCLRENGKLILIITAEELKRMCYLKMDQQDPSEVLLTKVDELLMALEK